MFFGECGGLACPERSRRAAAFPSSAISCVNPTPSQEEKREQAPALQKEPTVTFDAARRLSFVARIVSLGRRGVAHEPDSPVFVAALRSEERRVGKECRSRWSGAE